MADPTTNWLPTLITASPAEGYELALKLGHMSAVRTQGDPQVQERLRQEYANDAGALIDISQVVATHFATVAAANDYWRSKS